MADARIWRLKSLTIWLFVQQITTAKNKHILKFRIKDPMWGESTGHRWIPLTQSQRAMRYAFPCDDIMFVSFV